VHEEGEKSGFNSYHKTDTQTQPWRATNRLEREGKRGPSPATLLPDSEKKGKMLRLYKKSARVGQGMTGGSFPHLFSRKEKRTRATETIGIRASFLRAGGRREGKRLLFFPCLLGKGGERKRVASVNSSRSNLKVEGDKEGKRGESD